MSGAVMEVGGLAFALVVLWLLARAFSAGASAHAAQAERQESAEAAFKASQADRADGYEWNPDAMRWDRRR
jgi:hypothetical protein